MMDEKKKALIKKLQALAERGVGGEKEGAKQKLEQLMKKYGVEESDLNEDKEEPFDFRFNSEHERRLLTQIAYRTLGKKYSEKIYRYSRGKGQKTLICIHCTKAEGLQIGIEYDFYRELWKEEQDFFFSCFIQKHRIFALRPEEEIETDQEPLSPEEILRMQQAIGAMQDKTIRKQLEG